MKKLTYLAGAINGKNDEEVFGWRMEATDFLGKDNVVDPTVRDYRGKELDNYTEIVAGDIMDIDRCGIVLARCNTPSWGTAMEIKYAYDTGKHVVVLCQNMEPSRVSPWLRFHSSAVFYSMADALDHILEYWAK